MNLKKNGKMLSWPRACRAYNNTNRARLPFYGAPGKQKIFLFSKPVEFGRG